MAGKGSMRGTHFTVSQELQDELIDDIHAMLQQAQAMGVQIGQSMLDEQDRAISVGGARSLLQRAKDIVSGIIDHVRDAISNALGKEQSDGEQLSQSDIVDQTMNDLIAQLPELVAGDETHTAIEGAVYDTLQDAGVPEVRSVTEDDDRVCARCQANADDGPIKPGDVFPSTGDSVPPYHGRCRCQISIA